MPELPEVEVVVRGLQKHIPGRKIAAVRHDWPKKFPNEPEQVNAFAIGATITGVRRRAKVIIIDLSTDYSLIVHLKMTGQMIFIDRNDDRFGAGHPNASLIGALPDTSTRVEFDFEDGSQLFFNDQRKFGWVKLLPTEQVFDEPFFQKVGPEPLEPEFTPEVFISRIKRRAGTTVKAAILDQTVLAGIGNIYADESLWGAKIHPSTRVKELSAVQLAKLHEEIVYVLALSIEKGGSTSQTYVNAEGKKGSYIQFARVFRREGLDCPRCSNEITKSRVAGRGTHTCEVCQVIQGDVT